jgi:cation diffusion facilitator family transporter
MRETNVRGDPDPRSRTGGHDHDHGPGGHHSGTDGHAHENDGHGHDHNAPLSAVHARAAKGDHDHAPAVSTANGKDRGAAHDHPHVGGHGHDDHTHDGGHAHDGDHGHEHQGGPLGWLAELFGGHSHGAPVADEALEGSAEGIRAVKVSLVALFATAALQAFVVYFSGSVALLADTIHNLADALTAIPLWIAFVVGRRAATRRYTYGYGRAEDVAGLAIVAMIALSAALAGWQSIQKLLSPEPILYVWWVIAASIIGFIGNEAVAIYRIRVGQRIGSAALVADGQHARVDGLTSLAVLLGALGVLAGFPLADPIVGLLITIAIVFVLRDAVREIWWRLMDAVDPALVERLETAVRDVPGIQALDEMRVRWIGHTLHAEAIVQVDGSLSTLESHAIAEEARHAMLHAAPWLRSAMVHVDPCRHDGQDHHTATSHHFPDRREDAGAVSGRAQ